MTADGCRAVHVLRAVVVLVVGAAAEAALAHACVGASARLRALPGRPAGDLAAAFADVAALVALLAWTWLLLVAVTTAFAAACGASRPSAVALARRLAPRAARQTVLTLLGLGALFANAAVVTAAPTGQDPHGQMAAAGLRRGAAEGAHRSPLEGLPLPDRPSGGRRPSAPARAEVADRVVVWPGDSLWSIAARALGDDPSTAAIARSWPHWYDANRAVIGDDPDLLLPGSVLAAPPHAASTPHPSLPPDERP